MKRILQNTLAALNKRERNQLVLLAVGDVVISVLDIAVLACLVLFVHAYTQPQSQLKVMVIFKWLRGDDVLKGLMVLLALFIVKNIAAYLLQKARYRFVYNVAARISELNLLQYLEGSYHDYVGKDSAVHIRRISQQPVEFGHYVLAGFQQIFSEGVMILLAITAIAIYNLGLLLLLGIALVPSLLLLWLYVKRRLAAARRNVKTSSELSLQYLKEALSGYIESNVFDKKEFLADRYSNRQQTLNMHLAQLQSTQALPSRIMEIFAVAALVLLATFRNNIQVVLLGAFLAAAYKIIPGLVKILNASGQIKTYAFTAENMVSQNAIPQPERENIRSVEIKNVSYKQILHNVSLCAKSGEMVGLTGISGKGKTTLFNLLLGFLEPDKGEILFNDQQQISWKHISYVKQQPFLVHDTVLTNITLSKEYNEQQLQQAMKSAGLSFDMNTIITENGKNISGGQRQRIAFARALYKNADLLLLDEPFNELDDAAEQAMLQQLQQLQQQGKIIILITHNRKSLSFCTRTISLDA